MCLTKVCKECLVSDTYLAKANRCPTKHCQGAYFQDVVSQSTAEAEAEFFTHIPEATLPRPMCPLCNEPCKDTLQTHLLEDCRQALAQCEWCDSVLPKAQAESHKLLKCQKRPIRCIECGNWFTRQVQHVCGGNIESELLRHKTSSLDLELKLQSANSQLNLLQKQVKELTDHNIMLTEQVRTKEALQSEIAHASADPQGRQLLW